MNLSFMEYDDRLILRKFEYLRISVTDGCNLRCLYCNPEKREKISSLSKNWLKPDEIKEIVKLFTKFGTKKVRITGGEPLVRGDIVDIIKLVSSVEDVSEVALTTNGIFLRYYARLLKSSGLTRVNVSLPSLSDVRYREITGGDVETVLDGIRETIEQEIKIKINTVAYGKELLDEIPLFIDFLKEFKVQIRFIEYMPLCVGGYKREKFLDLENIEGLLIDKYGFRKSEYNRYIRSGIYTRDDLKGEIGFIRPVTRQFCDICNKIRISSKGELIPCLFSSKRLNILKLNEKTEEEILRKVVLFIKSTYTKPDIKSIIERDEIRSRIYEIGG
ncbi:MAG: GTP 3',8-cyclase MoaA [Deltaproteobacteria bacterium]|nr:GTP 3',8-cyclase MoaA [Deltaproteobacteria bacterium]